MSGVRQDGSSSRGQTVPRTLNVGVVKIVGAPFAPLLLGRSLHDSTQRLPLAEQCTQTTAGRCCTTTASEPPEPVLLQTRRCLGLQKRAPSSALLLRRRGRTAGCTPPPACPPRNPRPLAGSNIGNIASVLSSLRARIRPRQQQVLRANRAAADSAAAQRVGGATAVVGGEKPAPPGRRTQVGHAADVGTGRERLRSRTSLFLCFPLVFFFSFLVRPVFWEACFVGNAWRLLLLFLRTGPSPPHD